MSRFVRFAAPAARLAAILFAAQLVAGNARAAGPSVLSPKESAETLYKEALVALDKGDYEVACAKLERVIVLDEEKLIAHLKLGGCYEARGKLGSAWARYAVARGKAEKARKTGDAQIAARLMAALSSRLAMLTIVVPDGMAATPGLQIMRDGTPVERDHWSREQPVDKGTYRIEATAPGRLPWQKRLTVEADGARVSVVVGPLPPITPVVIADVRPWQKPLAIAVGGLGVAGLVAGVGLGGAMLGKLDESNRNCRLDDHCNRTGFDARNEARGLGDASTVAFVAGAALLGAGIVLMTTAPARAGAAASEAGRGSVRVEVSLGGLALKGVW